MLRRALFGVVLLAIFAACTPSTYVRGPWKFDGTGFGKHAANPENEFTCGSGLEAGSVQLDLRLIYGGRAPSSYAFVTFFPLDEKRYVDVQMPWSHVRFERDDCSRRAGNAAMDRGSSGGTRTITGELQLTCAKDGNTIDLDVSYVCNTHVDY